MSPARTGGRLPRELDSFVGRAADLTAVRTALGSSRLVTLTGPGGVGKTRLAVRAAAESLQAFPDGVWLVELADLGAGADVARRVLRVLGALDVSSAPSEEQLVAYLADRQLLLVLDNCEHLVEEVASLTHGVVRRCAGVRVLTTSREVLGVPGEWPLAVAPLPVPGPAPDPRADASADAVTLFAERAAAAVPGFVVNADNRVAVEQIVTRLDGLPLAIELAAARLRVMSPGELADRLDDRYRLLTQGRRTDPDRHQTLRTCVEWSYQQCSHREQLLWDRLSVFVGGFEIDAVEGVAGFGELDRDDVFDVLESLVAKSVVVRVDSPDRARFRLLETLRDYGAERLAERGEVEEAAARHRDWYAELLDAAAAASLSAEQQAWWSRLDRERGNTWVALERVLDDPRRAERGAELVIGLYTYCTSRVLLSGARRLHDRALAVTGPGPSRRRVRLLTSALALAGLQGDREAAHALSQDAASTAELLQDDVADGFVTYGRGFVALLFGDVQQAPDLLSSAMRTCQSAGYEVRYAIGLSDVVSSLALAGRFAEAEDAYAEGEAFLATRGEHYYRGHLTFGLALVRMMSGELAAASELLVTVIRLHAVTEERLGTAWALHMLSLCEGLAGAHERSAVLAGGYVRLRRDLDLPVGEVESIVAADQARAEAGRASLGVDRYDAAYARGESMGLHELVAFALGTPPEPDIASRTQAPGTAPVLTPREDEVAALVADGLTNSQIATRLFVTPRTVRGHLENILAKLGLDNRTQLASSYASRSDSLSGEGPDRR